MNIKEALEREVEQWAQIGSPNLLKRFVLIKGREFEKFEPWTGKPGEPNNCYQNAADAVLTGPYGELEYVEGFAFNKKLGFMLFQHAWIYDPKKKVAYDSTLNPDEYLYFGVRFPYWRLREELLRNEVYGLLSPCDMANLKLFAKMSREFSDKKIKELQEQANKNREAFEALRQAS